MPKNPRKPVPRKRRTREHVIADLGVNHVERHALRCGHVLERVRHDYGLDLVLSTFDEAGEVQNGEIHFQVKATEHMTHSADRKTLIWRLAQADLRHWLHEPMPVILIVYDAIVERAFWLYIQAYFEEHRRSELSGIGATVTVRIPVQNLFDETAVRELARYRDLVLAQMKGVIRHHE